MPFPTKTELAFSYVLESPGTQHVVLAAMQMLSSHSHVPKPVHPYTAMSRAWPSDSKFSGLVSNTVLRRIEWLLPLTIIPLQFQMTLRSMLPWYAHVVPPLVPGTP